MRMRSISFKLFLITSLFLIALITVIMVLQLNFFESYYKTSKITSLKNDIVAFKNKFVKPNTNLMTDSEAQAQIMKAMSELTTESVFTAIVHVDEDGGAQFYSFDKKLMVLVEPAVQEWAADADRYGRVLNNGETIAYESKQARITSSNSIVVVTLLAPKSGSQDVLFAVASLQPIGEAAGVIQNLYPYFLALAVVVILLLTFLYTRMISRPLVRLNDAATRMAALDFTTRFKVRSKDEIGNLGNTLNFLSQKLDETLLQLHSANRKLTQDIEKERQLEQMRKEFVAGVSHELKTPISLISGYAEGLKENIVGEERREEYLDVIMDETRRMSAIVTDLLDLSQLESMKFKLNVSVFSMSAAIMSNVNKMAMEIEKKGIRCDIQLPDKEIHVLGDRLRIGQVLSNLLSNAIKHTSPGGEIKVTLTPLPGQSEARIDVFNEGEAIPENEIRHIWDAFYKVEKSRNRESSGTGIGLTIVSSILLQHNSRFGVANLPKGVNFFFTLLSGENKA